METEIMAKKEEYFSEDLDLSVSADMRADLNTLFEPRQSVPPEIDRAVLGCAHQHLIRPQRCRSVLRWAAFPTYIGIAAVIIFMFSLNLTREPRLSSHVSACAEARADIDHNGRVDILDAFTLARHIESASRPEPKLDINGDGLVNREDVDLVAFAAVRLDKGIL
jgi:hypothetical protein